MAQTAGQIWRFVRGLVALVVSPVKDLPAIARLLTGRRGVPAGAITIRHGRGDRQMFTFALVVSVLEAGVVGLLFRSFAVMRYIDMVQWWAVALLMGMLANATVYPHVLTREALRVRARGKTYLLPTELISAVSWEPHKIKPEGDVLFLASAGGTQLAIDLTEPYQVEGTLAPIVRVLITADDKAAVADFGASCG